MAFDCYRCWNTGVYFAPDFRRFLRCTMCNSNFGDKRTGPQLATAVGIDKVPCNEHLTGSRESVSVFVERNEYTQRYRPYIEAELRKGAPVHAN